MALGIGCNRSSLKRSPNCCWDFCAPLTLESAGQRRFPPREALERTAAPYPKRFVQYAEVAVPDQICGRAHVKAANLLQRSTVRPSRCVGSTYSRGGARRLPILEPERGAGV